MAKKVEVKKAAPKRCEHSKWVPDCFADKFVRVDVLIAMLGDKMVVVNLCEKCGELYAVVEDVPKPVPHEIACPYYAPPHEHVHVDIPKCTCKHPEK